VAVRRAGEFKLGRMTWNALLAEHSTRPKLSLMLTCTECVPRLTG
jgi:hypothetical protein